MACPDSGPIKISDLVAEFGGSAPHALSEYYRNGGEVHGNNTNVPTSGQISLTQFYSAVNEIQQTYSSTTTNLNLSSVFGSNWGSTVPKRVIINSGVIIGGTSGNYAINIPSGMAGTLVIDNNGSIQGYGRAANGGNGGSAIHCGSTSGVTINNNSGASIKAGGGGGGQGGTGGTGGTGGGGAQGPTGPQGPSGVSPYWTSNATLTWTGTKVLRGSGNYVYTTQIRNSGANGWGLIVKSGGTNVQLQNFSGTAVIQMYSNGNVTPSPMSDRRVKRNIRDFPTHSIEH